MRLQEALKILRKELGYSQVELANQLHMSFPAINRWEMGRARPNYSTAINIMRLAKENGASAECCAILNEALRESHQKDLPLSLSDLYTVERESICQLVDESTTGVYVADMETDELLYVNHQAESYCGRKFDKQQGLTCYRFTMNRTKACEFCPKRHLSDTSYAEEHIAFPETGKTYLVRSKRIMWNGRPAHAQYLTDETDALSRQDGLKTLIDQLPAGVAVGYVYADGRIELSYLNDGYYDMIGCSRASRKIYISFFAMDAVCEEERETVRKKVIAAYRKKGGFWLHFHIRKARGDAQHLSMTGKLIDWTPERAKYCCSITDLEPIDHLPRPRKRRSVTQDKT